MVGLAPQEFAFAEEVALLGGRCARVVGDASLRFLAECAARLPAEVSAAAFLRVNAAAISMNAGNYWLARVSGGEFGVIALESPDVRSGWRVAAEFHSVRVLWLVSKAPADNGPSPPPWSTYADACLAAHRGPQGRLNTHPRKPAYPVNVLRRWVDGGS